MITLAVLSILLIVCGGISVHRARQREKEDYEEYMARRISFNVSETNSDK